MKTLLINGSPKFKNSNSDYYLELAKEYMQDVETKYIRWNKTALTKEEIEDLFDFDTLLFCFPLYVDSIPSHFLRCLMQVQEYANNMILTKKPMIYVMVNNGFFDGKENMLAIECMKNWSKRCGFQFGQGCCLGAAGMIDFLPQKPDEHSMNAKISVAIKEMVNKMKNGQSGDTAVAEPCCPSIVYKLAAEKGWRSEAKSNGLKAKDLDKRLL